MHRDEVGAPDLQLWDPRVCRLCRICIPAGSTTTFTHSCRTHGIGRKPFLGIWDQSRGNGDHQTHQTLPDSNNAPCTKLDGKRDLRDPRHCAYNLFELGGLLLHECRAAPCFAQTVDGATAVKINKVNVCLILKNFHRPRQDVGLVSGNLRWLVGVFCD